MLVLQGYTRINNSNKVYAMVKGIGVSYLLLCTREEMDTAQVTNGWSRWQDHVGNLDTNQASQFVKIE